jgi:hypothetical protein
MQFAMGENPSFVESTLRIRKTSSLFGLLRCKYVFDGGKIKVLPYNALPHLLLVPKWKVLDSKLKVLSYLKSPAFSPQKVALLESKPQFTKHINNVPVQDSITLLKSSSDWLDIKVMVNRKCILLITDTYAKGWEVFPYSDSSQQKYEVMPADYVIRGIPLSPGKHHFRLQYAPHAFRIGRYISLMSLIIYALTALIFLGRQ